MSHSPSQYCRHSVPIGDCVPCQELIAEEQRALIGDEPLTTGGLSVDDATIEALVQSASTPSLATLFKRGKETGLIQATTGYGENAGS